MRKLEKLISKVKEIGIGNTTISEMEISSFKRSGEILYTVLCTLICNKTKKYIRSTFATKDEAVSSVKYLTQKYPKGDDAVFIDWSAITEKEWDVYHDSSHEDEYTALLAFIELKQKAVKAWQEGNQ